jgi:pyruvate,orthophosphate dikinase
MAGLPVTIRLLDPPLHEFLPQHRGRISCEAVAAGHGRLDAATADAAARPLRLHEVEPDARPSRLPSRHVLPRDLRDAGPRHLRGRLRGGRLQGTVRQDRSSRRSCIPLALSKGEEIDSSCKARTRRDRTAERSQLAETGASPAESTMVGTMIELPRAALRAGEIAENGRVLLVRHQRPDADHVRHQPRRLGLGSSNAYIRAGIFDK